MDEKRPLVLLREPPDPPAGQGWEDLLETSVLADSVFESLAELRERVLSDDPVQATLACDSLGLARQYAMPPSFRQSRHVSPLPRTYTWVKSLYQFGGKVEGTLEKTALSLRREGIRSSWLALNWTPIRIILSAGVATLIITGHFGWAFLVLTARMAGSLLTGASWAFPAERRGTYTGIHTWECWTGHLCDAIVLSSIAEAAARAGRLNAACFLIAGLVVQLLATLARVAALQHGLQLLRLRLERVVRSGGTIIAVGIAAAVGASQHQPPWALLAILAGIPAFVYALLEGARVVAASYLELGQPVSLLVGSTEVFATSTSKVPLGSPRTGIGAA